MSSIFKILFAICAFWVIGFVGCSMLVSTGMPTHKAGEHDITLQQYERVKPGMTYEEAVNVLGRQGTEQSRVELGGMTTTMYLWNNSRSLSSATAMFQGDKLTVKSQFGLKEERQ